MVSLELIHHDKLPLVVHRLGLLLVLVNLKGLDSQEREAIIP